jgi:transposase
MLSESKRTEIIVLHNNGLSNGEISKKMNLHCNVISFWINRYYNTGSICDIKKTGRKRKTTKDQDNKICDEIKKNEKLTLDGIVNNSKLDVKISKTTVSRRLKERNIIYGNYSKKPLLLKKHIDKRLIWANNHTNYDWTRVIFSDEMSIWKDRDSNKCWYLKGNQKIKETIKHPIKVHIWGCITLGGLEAFHLFDHKLNSVKYTEILFEHLIPIYTDEFIFQQDNSPIHTAKNTKSFLKEMNVRTMDFPPNSPDLNPIENMWHLIKHYMSKLTDITNDNFREKVIECCKKINYSSIFNIISNMHVRIKKVIDNNGSHIDY